MMSLANINKSAVFYGFAYIYKSNLHINGKLHMWCSEYWKNLNDVNNNSFHLSKYVFLVNMIVNFEESQQKQINTIYFTILLFNCLCSCNFKSSEYVNHFLYSALRDMVDWTYEFHVLVCVPTLDVFCR